MSPPVVQRSPVKAMLAYAAKLTLAAAVAIQPPRPPTREEFVTSTEYCNPVGSGHMDASPVQRAICQAADGLPCEELSAAELNYHFGDPAFVATEAPKLIVLRGGVRSGKSLIAAIIGLIYGAMYADLSATRPGELVRAVIVAPRLRQTAAAFHHALGSMRNSPRLKQHLVNEKAESAIIRRPDGREVELMLLAASPGGINVRSTWLVGAVFDEADFFDSEDARVNLKDNVEAVEPRMLPDAQIWVVSSPWADTGPFHEMFTRAFGKPKLGVLAIHSDSRSMNPKLDPVVEEKLRQQDPDKHAREYMAIPISSSGTDFFPVAALEACIRRDRPVALPPDSSVHYGGTDLGFRKNSSALALARHCENKAVLAYHQERRPEPGKPLRPSVVVKEFATTCRAYRCSSMRGDLHYADTAHEELAKLDNERPPEEPRYGVVYDEWIPTQDRKTDAFTEFRNMLVEGQCELPDDPVLLRQIKATKSRPLPGGVLQIVLPKQGHTHGDVLMSVVLAMIQVPRKVVVHADEWASAVDDSRWGDSGRGY